MDVGTKAAALVAPLLLFALLCTAPGCTEAPSERAPTRAAPGESTPTVPVPDVARLTVSESSALLADAGLNVGEITKKSSDLIVADAVISQEPRAGEQAPEGSALALVVSTGPASPKPLAEVPDVVGMAPADAAQTLAAAGFRTDQVTTCNIDDPDAEGIPENQVYRQTPAAHATIPEGMQIQIRYWIPSS